PLRVLLVQLLRVPELTPPDAHQRLRDGDLPYPPPQVSLTAVLLDAPHHLEERLLEDVLRVLGPAQHAERQVVDGRLERPVQRFQRLQVARLRPRNENVGNGE